MSTPEWPPLRPLKATARAAPVSGAGAVPSASVSRVPPPPAQPTYRMPSSSESRLMSRRPCTSPPSRRAAPVSPVSSSIVNNSSSGPWGKAVSSITASIAATPTPLSEPRVVPAAVRYSPCICGTMASVAKSNATSAFFSCTMSRWLCKMVMSAPSCPGVAGLRTTRLPTASA